jgi:hypothetical protein
VIICGNLPEFLISPFTMSLTIPVGFIKISWEFVLAYKSRPIL